MKNTIKTLIVATLISSISVALNASEDQPKYRGYNASVIDVLPVPVERTVPVVKEDLIGATVVLKVTVDEFGIPTRVADVRLPFEIGLGIEGEEAYVAALVESVTEWDFEPALDKDGNPMEVTVRMPITIHERDGEQLAQVGVILDRNFASISG